MEVVVLVVVVNVGNRLRGGSTLLFNVHLNISSAIELTLFRLKINFFTLNNCES